jgi:hypothetical protein
MIVRSAGRHQGVTMKRCALLLGLLSILTISGPAHALGHVIVGNQPIGPESGYGRELLAAVNMDERVYAYIHDWHLSFYFKGGPKALNDAMRRFAAIPADRREIRLLPAPATPLIHNKPIPFDWCLRIPGNRHRAIDEAPRIRESEVADNRATLTIYIPDLLPPALTDPKAARKWIAELGSNEFKTRERAAKELTDLGPPVVGLIREAIKARPSPEARDRLEKLLVALSTTIRVDILDLPAGVKVVGLDDLLASARGELANKHPDIRAEAASALVEAGAPAEEILPDLEKMLKTEKQMDAVNGAVQAAYQLGAPARPLVPLLRDIAKTADKNLAPLANQVIDSIEKAKSEPISEADAKRRTAIRKEIRELLAARKEAASK